MAEVSGFFYPRTATGRSSLLPPPPWHYSGDLLTVEYRTDPARVAELLPGPLQPAPEDPGAVALIWADWQSCGDSGDELLDPVRAQYRECFAVVRCAFEGRVYSRCVYIWVDADFALARGLHQGYPKKLGSIHQTRAHPFGRAAPRIAPGGTFAGTLAAADRRLAQAGPASTLALPDRTSSSRASGAPFSIEGIHLWCAIGCALTNPAAGACPASVTTAWASRRSAAARVPANVPPGPILGAARPNGWALV